MNKKNRLTAAIVFLLAFLLLAAGCAKKQDSLQELLDLGRKYLLEENYEEAIVTFEKAIAVDDKNVDAYAGLADAYAGQGDFAKAEQTLQDGYDKTKVQELLDKKELLAPSDLKSGQKGQETEGVTGGTGNSSGTPGAVFVESSPILERLRNLLGSGDFLEAGKLSMSEELNALIESEGGILILPLSGDPENGSGTGLGIYRIEYDWPQTYNMLFYGTYEKGERSGHGVWVAGGDAVFEGEWSEDLPNGQGRVSYSLGGSEEGILADGKWDGETTVIDKNGVVYHLTYNAGMIVTLGPDPEEPEYLIISTEHRHDLQFDVVCDEERAATPRGVIGFVDLGPWGVEVP